MPRELLGDVNYCAASASRPRRSTIRPTSTSTTASPGSSTSSRSRGIEPASPAPGFGRSRRLLALDGNMAAAHYLLGLCQRSAGRYRGGAGGASPRDCAGADPCSTAARRAGGSLRASRTIAGRTRADSRRCARSTRRRRATSRSVSPSPAPASLDRAIMTLAQRASASANYTYTFVALGRVLAAMAAQATTRDQRSR